jgi:integrase
MLRAERQKQHADQFLDVGADAIEAAQAILDPPRPRFWPWMYSLKCCWERFGRICKAAGVPLAKGGGSKFHRIRKSTASYLKLNGGDPTGRLGHSSPKVTEAYFDPRICGESRQARFMPRLG